MITREQVRQQLEAYLHDEISSAELVDWAEDAMCEAEFEPGRLEAIREVIARLGVADVRAFGLTWKDCESMLEKLGYHVSVEVTKR